MHTYPQIYIYRQIVRAKLYMEVHYASPIRLDQIAEEAFFSKFHFIRLFKLLYGLTPHQYLTKVRIEKARLLLEENISVSEVCFLTGFESLASFSLLFKRQTSFSPSAYQQARLLRKSAMEENPLRFIPNCFAERNGWAKKAISDK